MRTCLLLFVIACGPSAHKVVAPSNNGGNSAAAAASKEAAPASADPSAPPPEDMKAPAAGGLAVTAIEPTSGDQAGGTYVVIKGSNFIKPGPRQLKVYFGGTQGSVVRFQSDNEVIVQAPAGKAGETVDVMFVFDPGGQLKLPAAFTFVDKP